jgi:hypothetical protein
MILRERDGDEGKFSIAGVDTRDESVIRHELFFLAKPERFMLECKKKQQMWQQDVVTVSGFSGVSSLPSERPET